MKKFCLLLCLIIVFSLTVTTFAKSKTVTVNGTDYTLVWELYGSEYPGGTSVLTETALYNCDLISSKVTWYDLGGRVVDSEYYSQYNNSTASMFPQTPSRALHAISEHTWIIDGIPFTETESISWD